MLRFRSWTFNVVLLLTTRQKRNWLPASVEHDYLSSKKLIYDSRYIVLLLSFPTIHFCQAETAFHFLLVFQCSRCKPIDEPSYRSHIKTKYIYIYILNKKRDGNTDNHKDSLLLVSNYPSPFSQILLIKFTFIPNNDNHLSRPSF